MKSQPKVSHPAVTSLAEGAELMERIRADRPRLIVNALLGDATTTEITAALGWDIVDLKVAINRRAPELRNKGQITERAYTAVNIAVFGTAP